MHIVVLGNEKVDGANCWKVDFLIPAKPVPAGLTGRYRVFVVPDDGWPRRAYSFRDYRDLPFDRFDKARSLTMIPDGYPVEIFPAADMSDVKGAKSPWILTVTSDPNTGIRIANLRTGEDNKVEIRQTWKEGENWWREYERYRNGKLDLRAKLVPRMVAKAPDPKPAPKEPPAKPPTTAKSPPPTTYIDQTNNPLRLDPRLQATVTLRHADPSVQDILDRLSKATKLTFSAEEDADTSTPVMANITWVNIPAWSAMDQLARFPNINGRWEKMDGGYRLDGVPQSLRPAPSAKSYVWAWTGGGVALVAALAGAGWLVYRRRGAKP